MLNLPTSGVSNENLVLRLRRVQLVVFQHLVFDVTAIHYKYGFSGRKILLSVAHCQFVCPIIDSGAILPVIEGLRERKWL